jgi:NAD(P)-dependent dehydrogenase (short-subunit alcohol dehydrogenase family)
VTAGDRRWRGCGSKCAVDHLEGRTAVVTGAASGIGRAMAERFAAAGMRVVLGDVEAGPLEEVATALRDGGADVEPVVVDVSDGAAVDALAAAAGTTHLLCNNAGVGGGGPVAELAAADWEWVLGVNLWGVIHGLRAFLPGMLAHGEPAHVVNTASMAGLVAGPMMGPYNATKFAVVAISETLHHEMSMTGSNVGVSVLCPGWVNTRIHQSGRNRPAAAGPAREVRPERAAMMAAVLASGLDPAEVAVQVERAVLDGRFWILTHPEMKEGIERRMRSILDEENPTLRLGSLLGGDPD